VPVTDAPMFESKGHGLTIFRRLFSRRPLQSSVRATCGEIFLFWTAAGKKSLSGFPGREPCFHTPCVGSTGSVFAAV
jgi:hypothetical protein